MKTKKHLILLILKILESETDSTHPLTQKAIVESISKVYNCDRKTVGRNIKFLTEIGYPIVKTGKGFYLENKICSTKKSNFVRLFVWKLKRKYAILFTHGGGINWQQEKQQVKQQKKQILI